MNLFSKIFRGLVRLQAAPAVRMFRPWAIGAPVVVLLITIPMLRPLRHPDPQQMSTEEQSLLASVQAIVENRTLAIDHTLFAHTSPRIKTHQHLYSEQPPMFSVLLSAPYWVMHRYGITFEGNALLVMFFLTLLGVTLPVALSAGMVYKMGRLFELRRPLRAALALLVVLGSGLASYATVLNPHAPAAVLLLAAAACLFHTGLLNHAGKAAGWLFLAGICAALSATIDPPAVIFTAALALVVMVFRWSTPARLAAIVIYATGVAIPLFVHASLNRPITGDLLPAVMHPELLVMGNTEGLGSPRKPSIALSNDDDEEDVSSTTRTLTRIFQAFFGSHGILTHFPIVLVGIVGVSMVMHRHWPPATKMLASVTLGGALSIIIIYAMSSSDWHDAMFANRWFVIFLPLTVFWVGVWLRRPHRPRSWAIAGVAIGFSVVVSVIGATDPMPRDGFDHYTAMAAAQRLFSPAAHTTASPMFAGR